MRASASSESASESKHAPHCQTADGYRHERAPSQNSLRWGGKNAIPCFPRRENRGDYRPIVTGGPVARSALLVSGLNGANRNLISYSILLSARAIKGLGDCQIQATNSAVNKNKREPSLTTFEATSHLNIH